MFSSRYILKVREHPELEKPAKAAKPKKDKKAIYKSNGKNKEEEIKLNVIF